MRRLNIDEFIDILRDFSTTQSLLVNKYTGLIKNDIWPKTGTVSLNGDTWCYRKHGVGVCFKDLKRKTEIDAHFGMLSYPNGFDLFRLDVFFSSKKKMAVSYRDKCFNTKNMGDIEMIINILLYHDKIISVSERGVFILAEYADNVATEAIKSAMHSSDGKIEMLLLGKQGREDE
jgi:hypothetical protein